MDLKKLRKEQRKREELKIEYRKFAGFHVYRSEDKSLPFEQWERLTKVPQKDKNFADTTAEPGKKYFYLLQHIDVHGNKDEPYEPRGFWTDDTGEKIEHDPQNDVVGYHIYRSTDPDLPLAQWERRNSELLPTTGFEDKGTESGVTYYYYVTAVSAAGLESKPSKIASVVGK